MRKRPTLDDKQPDHPKPALRFLAVLYGSYLALCFAQRVVYSVWMGLSDSVVPWDFWISFFKGIPFDLAVAHLAFLPVSSFLLLAPTSWLNKRWARNSMVGWIMFSSAIILFSTLAEVFFFDEFKARFNFIAVDYLIYTTEVLKDVWESYSTGWILVGFACALIPVFLTVKRSVRRLDLGDWNFRARLPGLSASLVLLLLTLLISAKTESGILGNDSYWKRELSKNSIYTIISAYFKNSIEYQEFYPTLALDEACGTAHESFFDEKTSSRNIPVKNCESLLSRSIPSHSKDKDLNVVLVVMESLSARFMNHFGETHHLTPNLDRLADEGLLFTNLYATGTRTVRGLEALMLSVPPTPGQSILRRPKSDDLFNLGTVFKENGYQNQFIYGGHAYFDNMKEWFESNGFEVVDRPQFPKSEIGFSNAWGVCDEDLFKQVLKQADSIHSSGKKFFQVVLNTSNHRPYTYPSGRIDIPSHTNREGAVKYSDYAIGQFVEAAKSKPWFSKTLFVFVADHNASVAGGVDIPVRDYLIPAIFYAPGIIAPQKMTKLASQIDVAPTLLSFLGFSYKSSFFGQDLFTKTPDRALLGTYQKIALLVPGQMNILSPGKKIEELTLNERHEVISRKTMIATKTTPLTDLARQTVAIYQSASHFYTAGLLKRDLLLKSHKRD